MTLYIAICDDHVPDRKQLERLLGREKDERLKTNLILYIDSFGSREALLNAQIQYDLILTELVSQKQLSYLIDTALENQKEREPLIEIRDKDKTYRIPQHDIIFAREIVNITELFLTESRTITMLGKMNILIQQLYDPHAFGYCADHYMVNFAHVVEMKKNAFVMDNKDVVNFHFLQRHELKNALVKYRLRGK